MFKGYIRKDGSIGIRNHLVAVPASGCAAPLVSQLAHDEADVVGLVHQSGCCQLGADFERTTHVLTRLSTHPNVGAVLFVALGCEGTPSKEVVKQIRQSGRPVRFIHIQNEGGSRAALARAKAELPALRAEMEATMVTGDASLEDLVVGLECGGSDATSGIAANPAIGWVADELVKAGAKVILSETTELLGAEHVITKNVRDKAVKEKIIAAVHRVETECNRIGVDIRGSQPTPGNIAGGLSTIEEKSMGCAYKSGSSPFIDFLEYGEPVRKHGLSFMDTPGQDVESMTGMAAGGATLFLFSTGRGSPVGSPTVPTIKITGNAETFRKMQDDIDIDVSHIFRDGSLHEAGEEVFLLLQKVCAGARTRSEETGYHAVSIFSHDLTL